MLPLDHPDRIQIAFDDHRLVADAGLLLPVTLAVSAALPTRSAGSMVARANTPNNDLSWATSGRIPLIEVL